jgi:NADPH:quinone reductase-like Zn-dependent oxidoreductase
MTIAAGSIVAPKERAVKAAGIREFGASVELLELPGPRALRPDEVLIDIRACGMGNWDEIARTGGWDLGARPPMALGVDAAANAVPSGSVRAMRAVRDRGRLATRPGQPSCCCPGIPAEAARGGWVVASAGTASVVS